MMNNFFTKTNFLSIYAYPFLTKVLGVNLIILFFSYSIMGQNFAPIGATWHYTHGGGLGSGRIGFNLIKVVGDTIIGDKRCSILEKKTSGCTLRPMKEYVYEEEGQVLYYNNFYKTFNLLYDFNLIEGDTLNMVAAAGYSNIDDKLDTILFKVDSITFIEINNNLLKQQHISLLPSFNFHYFYGENGIITEKLGHHKNMFPWYFGVCDGSVDFGIRCYEDEEIGYYETGIAESCIFTGLEEIHQDEIKIFPNPVHNNLVIDLQNQLSTTNDIFIRILDITRKMVLQSDFQENINVHFLEKGIYFLHLFDFEGRQFSYKFLKL